MDFRQEIVEILVKETKLKEAEIENILSVPPDAKLGDYAFPCFKLKQSSKAKPLGPKKSEDFSGNPKEAAEQLKEKIKLPNFIAKVQVVGPYLNFFVNQHVFAEETLKKIYQKARDYGKHNENKKIVIEYCGPNTNKPLHLGHIRNMALGIAVCNLLAFQGNKVHPVNIINDRGIHICQSMLAYQKWGKNSTPDKSKKKGDHFVGDYYVMFSKKAKDNEDLKSEAQELLLKWEKEDKETRTLWKKMNQWVLDGFKETYKRFGVKFDKEYSESSYYEKGKEVALEGLKKKVFEKDHTDAIIAPLEKYNLPDKVILRADGTSVYMTQDLYLAGLRYKDFKYNKLIYVVASEQANHFKQLFKILELLKEPFAKGLHHLSYGMVHLPSGRMKSREGTVIDADDLMDETAELAKEELKKRYGNLSEEELDKRAEFIAVGAIKFFMVKTDSTKDITFNPKESLSFDGETAPYLQYTHARACSILRKAAKEHDLHPSVNLNFETFVEEEKAVIKLLYNFPQIIVRASNDYKPHHIAQYSISLAQAFNEFYHKCPVISEVRNQMKARLLLVDCVRQVLENGLNLLGIHAPEEM